MIWLQSEDDPSPTPDEFDKFLGKKIIFKVMVRVYEKTMNPSFTIMKMSDDDTVVNRFARLYSVLNMIQLILKFTVCCSSV